MTAFASTFVNLYTEVLTKGRLDSTADLAKSKNWINLAYTGVAVASRFIKGSSTGSALSAAASSQALPTTIVELEQLVATYSGRTNVVYPVAYTRLLQLRQQSGATGPPRVYALRQGTIEFWPSAVGGETLTSYGAVLPDVLSGDSDTVSLPEPFAWNLLTYGALIHAAEFKADLLLMGEYQNQYGAWFAGFMAFCNRRETQVGQGFEVYTGYPQTVPSDPSSDWFVYTGLPWSAS